MAGQWKLSRAVDTREPGVVFDGYGAAGPELCFADGARLNITPSLSVYKLVFKCVGCGGGRQHYKVCTAKSLSKLSDLWCPFCFYNEQEWQRATKRLLVDCELLFTAVLICLGMDTEFSFQTMAPFWSAPLDFHHLQCRYYVQVDGVSHWKGIRGKSRWEVLAKDMQQNVRAMSEGGVVVRIHHLDLWRADAERVVLAALHAATLGCSLVLTPSYAAEPYRCGERFEPYVQVAEEGVRGCRRSTDEHGIIMFWTV
jgi:hypothetical protein